MTILKNIKEHWMFLIILFLGIAFRFIPIGQYQFSHDELSGLSRTVFTNLSDEITYGVKVGDTHPALIQVFLYYWVHLFGYSEIAIKIPFLLCGVLSIGLIYRFCLTFFSKKVALTASVVVSLSFIFLVYSSYARMYITGILFSLMVLLYVFKIMFHEKVSLKEYVLFSLSCLLCAYNQHISCLFAFSVALLGLFYIPKNRLKWYLLSCAVTVLLYLPHLSITLYQFSVGGIGASAGGWLTPPRNTEIYYFVKALFGCGISAKLIVLGLFMLCFSSVFKLIPITKKQVFLFWIFLINYLIIHLYSVFKNPVLQYSVLLFCGLCLIILLCSFVEFLSLKKVYVFCGFIAIMLCFQSVFKKHIFSKVHIQDFESQVKTTLDLQKQYGTTNVAAIYKTEDFFVYVYEKKYNTRLKYLSLKDSVLLKPALFRQYLKQLSENYIVLGGCGAEDIALVKEYFPYLVSHREDYFRNTMVFSKQVFSNSDASLVSTRTLLNSDVTMYTNKNKPLTFYQDSISFPLDTMDDEFPFHINLPLQKTDFKLGQYVLAEISYSTASGNKVDKERLCASVSEKDAEAVFFKTTGLHDYYDSTKRVQTAYLEYFVGVDNVNWKHKGMGLNFFIWKYQHTAYTIRDFKLKQLEYNPTKWTLWD